VDRTNEKSSKDQEFSEEEAERRFIAAVKAGLSTKPVPLKKKRAKRRAKVHQRRTSKTRAAIDDAEG